jgi:hypothetical protein
MLGPKPRGARSRAVGEAYASGYINGWPELPHRPMPALQERGFSGSLGGCSNGPAHEIADLAVSCVTRWADEHCIAYKGARRLILRSWTRGMSHLIDLFPVGQGGIPPRRRGHSIVVHAGNRTGKELLRDHVDLWAQQVMAANSPSGPATDIPF